MEGPASDAGKGTIRETDEASTTATAHTRRGRHARAQVRSKGLLSKRRRGRNTALQSQWLTVHQPDRETTSTQVTAAVRVRNRKGIKIRNDSPRAVVREGRTIPLFFCLLDSVLAGGQRTTTATPPLE